MHGEAGFRDAREALDALEVDRRRVRRRVRAASWWFYPALSLMMALSLAGPALERSAGFSGFWVSIAALGGVTLLVGLHRWQVGVAVRLSFDGASITVVVLLIVVLLALFLTTMVSERFGFEHMVGPVPFAAFIITLISCVLLDRFGALGRGDAR